jgi:hypothetical protein
MRSQLFLRVWLDRKYGFWNLIHNFNGWFSPPASPAEARAKAGAARRRRVSSVLVVNEGKKETFFLKNLLTH